MAQKTGGTKLKIGTYAIAEISSIGGLDISADTIDTTTLDNNGYKTFIQGMKDAGEVSISGFFNPGDTNGQAALFAALENGIVESYTILFPSAMGASWAFSGIVTGFSTSAELEDAISFEATIKVTGKPTLGLIASAGITNLSLSGTGGILSPSFANGVYYYAFDGVEADAIAVTATAAGQTIALYVDGAFVQNLTSGSASAEIPFSEPGTKKLTILANEPAKTQKTYEIVVIKG